MSDDHGGGGLPKFVVAGLGAIGLALGVVYVGLPTIATGTCATLGVGCSVPDKLWHSDGGYRATAGPPRFASPAPVGNGHPGQFLAAGCPVNVRIGDVFACNGPTGRCICK